MIPFLPQDRYLGRTSQDAQTQRSYGCGKHVVPRRIASPRDQSIAIDVGGEHNPNAHRHNLPCCKIERDIAAVTRGSLELGHRRQRLWFARGFWHRSCRGDADPEVRSRRQRRDEDEECGKLKQTIGVDHRVGPVSVLSLRPAVTSQLQSFCSKSQFPAFSLQPPVGPLVRKNLALFARVDGRVSMKRPGKKTTAADVPNARGRRVLTGALRGPNLRAAVGKNIRKIRRDLGLTLAKMEERTGIDSAYIGAMERGVQNITMDSLSNLAAAYGVQPHDLICGIGYGVSPSQLVTLDFLARLTSAVDVRVQSLLLEQGAVPVGSSTLASVLGALFEAAGRREQYAPTSRP